MDSRHPDRRHDGGYAPGGFARRFERKYFVAPRRLDEALSLLRHTCVPDRNYPRGQITSLYFDSDDLEEYHRSLAGEIARQKVRIRWYGTVAGTGSVSTFLERKMRWGAASEKRRLARVVPATSLRRTALRNGILAPSELLESLARIGHFPAERLRPVVTVSYDRYRFVEAFTGKRVSLDYHMRSTSVAPDVGLGERKLPMRGVIIEVKGPDHELPPPLMHLRSLGVDWTRFSKYGQAVESHLEPTGSVGRLWPSGRVGEHLPTAP